MSEAEFNRRIEETLRQVEQAVEDSGADIDFENRGDILTLTFGNGSKIILNRQGAVRQLWVAAKRGGFHYDWRGERWLNDQGGGELLAELSALISEQAGVSVTLS